MDLERVKLGPAEESPEASGDWPYPEDHPDALAPHESLLDPGSSRPVASRRTRGRPIGTRHAFDLRDIAVVATLLEAAKFQRLRGRAAGGPLIIWPTDLREYRHQPSPATALVLVIDHSCWAGWDKDTPIGPYLYRAYRENAALSVVEFGRRDAKAELRAASYRTRSLLDPRVADSLDRPPGLASPLAHALDLAVQEVRRHSRATPHDRVVLLVATDGRGNVPLAASLLNRLPHKPVGQAGIQDALTAAAAVKAIRGVEAIVVTPGVDQYADLPFDLAEAMGGKVIITGRPARQLAARA
jgi:magnesium chelatase subunit D